MALRNLADDGEAQSAAVGAAAEDTMEALEYALALCDRNAWPIVFHAQQYFILFEADPRSDNSAGLGVADSVVEQVAQHFLDGHGVAFYLCCLFRGEY